MYSIFDFIYFSFPILFSLYLFLFYVLGANTNTGIVLSVGNIPCNRSKYAGFTVVGGEYNQHQSHQFVSSRTNSPYSTTSYGSSGGGSASWQGKCPHCYQEYANISSLKYHVRLVHSEANNTICCYLCSENFTSKLVMREHLFNCHNVKYQ